MISKSVEHLWSKKLSTKLIRGMYLYFLKYGIHVFDLKPSINEKIKWTTVFNPQNIMFGEHKTRIDRFIYLIVGVFKKKILN